MFSQGEKGSRGDQGIPVSSMMKFFPFVIAPPSGLMLEWWRALWGWGVLWSYVLGFSWTPLHGKVLKKHSMLYIIILGIIWYIIIIIISIVWSCKLSMTVCEWGPGRETDWPLLWAKGSLPSCLSHPVWLTFLVLPRCHLLCGGDMWHPR